MPPSSAAAPTATAVAVRASAVIRAFSSEHAALTLSEVDAGFSAIGAISGKGSTAARKALVSELFGRATETEAGPTMTPPDSGAVGAVLVQV